MLTHEQAVPSHAEAPAPALTRSPKSDGTRPRSTSHPDPVARAEVIGTLLRRHGWQIPDLARRIGTKAGSLERWRDSGEGITSRASDRLVDLYYNADGRTPAPITVDHVAQVKTKRRAEHPPRPIQAMPDLAGMSPDHRFAACFTSIQMARADCYESESIDHRFALLAAAWRILAAAAALDLDDDMGSDIADARNNMVWDRRDDLARRLLDMPATRPAHIAIKREIIADRLSSLSTGNDQEDADILAVLDEAVGLAAPTPDDIELDRLGAEFMRAVEPLQPMNCPGYVAQSPDIDEMDAPLAAAFDLAEAMLPLKATTPHALAAKAAAMHWHDANYGDLLRTDQGEMYGRLVHSLATDLLARVGRKPPRFANEEC